MTIDLSKYALVSRKLSKIKEASLGVILVLNFAITFRLFNNTILSAISKLVETGYLGVLLLYLASRFIHRIFSSNVKLNGLEIMYVIFLSLPALPAIAATQVWDQPFLLGLISMRGFYLIIGGLLIYNLCKDNPRKLLVLEKSMVSTAWIGLVVFYLTSFFVNPAQFLDSRIVSYSANRGGLLIFKFGMGFVFFGCIYYFIRLVKKGSPLNLAYFMAFFIYLTFFRLDRTSITAVVLALGLFYILNIQIRKQLIAFFAVVLPMMLALIVYYLIDPGPFENFLFMFENMAYVLSGQTNPEVGFSVRFYEADIANKYIEKNPFLGNGKLSNAFIEGGFNALFMYFFPSDIGLIGTIFTYGIPGAFILYSQFIFAIYWISKIRYFRKNVFFQSCCFYLLVLFLDSISNGYLTVFAAQTISVIAIIFLFYEFDKYMLKKITVQNDHLNVQTYSPQTG
ncbi:MAG: O-antigen ligase family protein [Flavobacteriales bacterium]|nr:O-antigen ligase family protein [Flavobacteriales bacterium]